MFIIRVRNWKAACVSEKSLEVYLTTAAVYGGSVAGIHQGQAYCGRGGKHDGRDGVVFRLWVGIL